ncbi:hypothetical protein BJ322DRAFT_251217 [Thelephora terrestris]|uniref:Uncharacterized protein n=1 Tax=Thelephora terrestris TaxID=56493 RepID=A0A9P6L0L5_9AGAM|nr:hypothetical protein BJ322DRAFT_513192 [Thelephora terrestris]KAF9781882.1 hypothetical protein BJ322DRAFT_251217 [Thelephora terrestris]
MVRKFRRAKLFNTTTAVTGLDMAIDALNIAQNISSITPAKAVFGTVGVILVMIRDFMENEQGYVELGKSCYEICTALDLGIDGKKPEDISRFVWVAVDQLLTTVAAIQRKVDKLSKLNPICRFLRARTDKGTIADWKAELNRILQIFNLAVNTNVTVYGIHRRILEGFSNQVLLTQSSIRGELPPPAPRNCFGRDELIKKVVDFAEDKKPVALIGAGGIGKTSIALTVLHHESIKRRFGDNRRFVRCDQFTASRANFLRRLSEVIGAGVENPESLAPLRPALASEEMFIVLDNAESILDPQGADAQEIYDIVEELSQFGNISLAITSRIRAIPPYCKRLDIPAISLDDARKTFYDFCDKGEQPALVDEILEQLDFHPLSVTLLATVAHQNEWNNNRLGREWRRRQTGVLQTEHGNNLAATIELSLASPTFQALGPDVRGILEVIAFFPQGINEKSFHLLFPTISDGIPILDKLCNLSLTYRCEGFVTMLAPLRDSLRLKDPKSSSLLLKTKECYFTRLSVEIECYRQGNFKDSEWITLEDTNVEYLIDVFTSIDPDSEDVWNACANFMKHLHWHKQRTTALEPKVKALPDSHPCKALCLFELSRVLKSTGSDAERKVLLSHAVRLEKEKGDRYRVALALMYLSDANLELGFYDEGMEQAKEALDIIEPFGIPELTAASLNTLAWSLHRNGQLDDAEEAATRALNLLPKEGQEFLACKSHRILGDIFLYKEKREEGIRHLQEALTIAPHFSLNNHVIWIHHSIALLLFGEDMFDHAETHIKLAESHAANNVYFMARTVLLRAWTLYRRGRSTEAMSEASRALRVFENLGATKGQGMCEGLLQNIDQSMKGLPASCEPNLKFHWYTIRDQPINETS